MALRKVPIAIPLASGVDTKTDAKQVAPTKLLTCENGVFTKGGSIVKRNGTDSLGVETLSGTDAAAFRAMAKRGDELVAFTSRKAYSWLSDRSKWVDAGDVVSVAVDHEVVANRTTDQTDPDCASLSGVTAYAWEDSEGGVWYAVTDTDTGRTLVAPTQADASGTKPKVWVSGARIHVGWVDSTNIQILVINPDDPTNIGPAQTPVSSLSGTYPSFDVAEIDGRGTMIVWVNLALNVGVAYLAADGSIDATYPPVEQTDGGDAYYVAVCDDRSDSAVIAMYCSSNNFVNFACNGDLTGFGGLDTLDNTAYTVSDIKNITVAYAGNDDAIGSYVWGFMEFSAASDRDRYVKVSRQKGAISGVLRTQRGCGLASKAFVVDDRAYVCLVHDTTLFGTYFVQSANGVTIARLMPGLAGGVTTRQNLPSVQVASSIATVPLVYKRALDSANNDVFTEKGIRRVTMDFDSTDSHASAELGESLYIGGGMLHVYDGERVAEAQPHYAPDDVTTPSSSNSTGSLTGSGAYTYRFVYETTLANGEIVRGPVSAGTSVTLGASDNTVDMDIPTYRHSGYDSVRIGVYRSLDGDASRLFRVSSLDPSATGANGYVENDSQADSVSFTDEMSDAVAQTKEPLYTNGGILSNAPTEGGRVVAGGKSRIFASDPADPHVVNYTKDRAIGYAAEPSQFLQIRLDPYGGDITAMRVMDDNLIVFKERAVFAVQGDGANAAGQGDFSKPVLVTSDVGCVSADSLEYTPLGVVFQSEKGIYMLGRDLQVQYMGAEVEQFTRVDGQTVVSADILPDRTEIVMLCDSGVALVYNYFFKQWSTFTDWNGKDAVVVDGVYYFIDSNGVARQETVGVYKDDTRHVKRKLGTAWIKGGQSLQSWQRTYELLLIGEYKSAHTLTLRVFFDYSSEWSYEYTLDPSQWYDAAEMGDSETFGDADEDFPSPSDKVYQHSVDICEPCQAVRFELEENEAAGQYGEAFELQELLVVVGMKRQAAQLADTRRY